MQRERQNKQNKPIEEKKEGYIIVPNYFLKKWVKVLGVGPVVLYQELLTYCHKEKYIAWPTMDSLCQQMGIAKTTLLRYQNTLIKFGLIKNIRRAKSTTGHYRNNIYKITSLEELSEHPDPGKIIDFLGSKMKPDWYQNDTCIGSNLILSLVSKRYPNNTNLNITNSTTTKDAVVDFKKRKNKGEEKMRMIRERMLEFDFTESFTGKVLKEYPLEKVEEKLELYAKGREVRNPTGWFIAALREGYGEEKIKDKDDISPSRFKMDYSSSRNDTSCSARLPRRFTPRNDRSKSQNENEKTLSREEAIKRIQEIRQNLMAVN
ncbi:MAG: helix-turn-helix domain-containing protein [Candidatus Atribacteria bacterium]|nr:helix-turn-helix domain-containing protein [Candidatus Atribacteria bacterium]